MPSAAQQDIPYTLIDLHRYLRPHCVICVLSSESQFETGKLGRTFSANNMSSPSQVCGVPYTEMQEFGQTFGGSPAELQPRSMPRPSPGDLWQNHLRGCGLRLVFLSLATGKFYDLNQNCLYKKYCNFNI